MLLKKYVLASFHIENVSVIEKMTSIFSMTVNMFKNSFIYNNVETLAELAHYNM